MCPGHQCILHDRSWRDGPRATLQELWVIKEFKEALTENHNLICSSMVSHLFNTYIPKSELDLTKSNTSLLEIKCNELGSLPKGTQETY